MSSESKPKQALSDAIFDDLLAAILSDHRVAGEKLESERDLAHRYDTNRNTLREALQRLESLNLIAIRHGQGITVQDFRRTATFDVVGPFLRLGSNPAERVRVIADLLVTRARILAMCMELAATRASVDDNARIDAIVERQLLNYETDDRSAMLRDDVELIDAVVDAAHSLMARWLANTLLRIYHGVTERSTALWVVDRSYPEFLRGVRDAIAQRDSARAMATALDYYQRVDQSVLQLLAVLFPEDH